MQFKIKIILKDQGVKKVMTKKKVVKLKWTAKATVVLLLMEIKV